MDPDMLWEMKRRWRALLRSRGPAGQTLDLSQWLNSMPAIKELISEGKLNLPQLMKDLQAE